MSTHTQPFHILPPSRWPLFIAISLFVTVIGLVLSWSGFGCHWFVIGFYPFLISTFCWFSSISAEAYSEGCHSLSVQGGLRIGMCLFIVSEIMFFFGFFWAYLHCSLSPNIELGSMWPPAGISPIPFLHLPLLNTVILLSSGATLTWSHYMLVAFSLPPIRLEPPIIANLSWSPTPNPNILSPNHLLSAWLLFTTIILGVGFIVLQAFEYSLSSFTIADSSFGSCFYLATGFHGLHVFFGILFLSVILFRLSNFHFTSSRHLGLEFAIWYWHFVDVVWLLLFLIIYVWGS